MWTCTMVLPGTPKKASISFKVRDTAAQMWQLLAKYNLLLPSPLIGFGIWRGFLKREAE